MKGQAAIIPAVASLIFIGVFILVGMVVYGYASEATPHDDLKFNESLIAGIGVNNTLYEFDYYPVINSTVVCSNASGAVAMTNGIVDETCLGYNVVSLRYLNFTNSTAADNCQISDVKCDYTYDWATITGQDEFWDSTTASSFAGFTLVSVAVIIIAYVAVISIVLLMRG